MKALGHTVNVRSLQTTDPDSGKQLNTKISKTLGEKIRYTDYVGLGMYREWKETELPKEYHI
jgi:hypothetical protein